MATKKAQPVSANSNSHAHVDAEVGLRIRRVRLEQELSQRQLAVNGVSYAYISRLEAGHRIPTLSALAKIADKLGTTGLYLATGNEEAPCPFCHRGYKPADLFDGRPTLAAAALALEKTGRGIELRSAVRRACRATDLDDRQTDMVISAFNVLALDG